MALVALAERRNDELIAVDDAQRLTANAQRQSFISWQADPRHRRRCRPLLHTTCTAAVRRQRGVTQGSNRFIILTSVGTPGPDGVRAELGRRVADNTWLHVGADDAHALGAKRWPTPAQQAGPTRDDGNAAAQLLHQWSRRGTGRRIVGGRMASTSRHGTARRLQPVGCCCVRPARCSGS